MLSLSRYNLNKWDHLIIDAMCLHLADQMVDRDLGNSNLTLLASVANPRPPADECLQFLHPSVNGDLS